MVIAIWAWGLASANPRILEELTAVYRIPQATLQEITLELQAQHNGRIEMKVALTAFRKLLALPGSPAGLRTLCNSGLSYPLLTDIQFLSDGVRIVINGTADVTLFPSDRNTIEVVSEVLKNAERFGAIDLDALQKALKSNQCHLGFSP